MKNCIVYCIAAVVAIGTVAASLSPGGVSPDSTNEQFVEHLRNGTVPGISDAAEMIKNFPRDSLEIRKALYALLDDDRPGERAVNSDGSPADFGFSSPRSAAVGALNEILELDLPRTTLYDPVASSLLIKAAIDANPEVLENLEATLADFDVEEGPDNLGEAGQAETEAEVSANAGEDASPVAPATSPNETTPAGEDSSAGPAEIQSPDPDQETEVTSPGTEKSVVAQAQSAESADPAPGRTGRGRMIWVGLGAVLLAGLAALWLRSNK